MNKRQQQAKTRAQEAEAIRMYLVAGATLKQIKRRTTVAPFIVKGLVVAIAMGAMRRPK